MMNTTTINFNNISLDIHPGPIGISVSGGADSAILLYILMKYSLDPIHVFSCSSKEKNRISPHVALDVIDKCIDLTKNSNVNHHIYFVDKQTLSSWMAGLILYVNNKLVEIMYTGVTSMPPQEVTESFGVSNGLEDKRSPKDIRPLYYPNKIYTPFFNIDKRQICELYKELGVLDELYPVTRSCENLYFTSGHCGQCWWCKERLWGFGYL